MKLLRRILKDLVTLVPFVVILIIPLSPLGHVLVFSFIQRFFPDFFPSQFTESRQNIMSMYSSITTTGERPPNPHTSRHPSSTRLLKPPLPFSPFPCAHAASEDYSTAILASSAKGGAAASSIEARLEAEEMVALAAAAEEEIDSSSSS